VRLGTGMKRPTTGIRPIGTAMRQGTSANVRGESGFKPVGNTNNLNVDVRPITNHGIGMKTGVKRQDRIIQDNV